ncbi:MAG: hypothetical protein ACOCSK_00515, partial [Rhodothermales bacterium]
EDVIVLRDFEAVLEIDPRMDGVQAREESVGRNVRVGHRDFVLYAPTQQKRAKDEHQGEGRR